MTQRDPTQRRSCPEASWHSRDNLYLALLYVNRTREVSAVAPSARDKILWIDVDGVGSVALFYGYLSISPRPIEYAITAIGANFTVDGKNGSAHPLKPSFGPLGQL